MSAVTTAAHHRRSCSDDPPQPQEEELIIALRVPPAVVLPVKDGARVLQLVQPDDSSQSQKMMELRGWLMVLATVIASITYASGLSPPGGFERAARPRVTATNAHEANAATFQRDHHGTTFLDSMMPALREASPGRFRAFYYCNTAAFALSLSIMLLLASRDLRKLARTKALEILVGLDLLALLVAYIAGSTFGVLELAVCSGLVLIVPLALGVVSSSRLGGKYFWDEVSSE